jgi:GSH-dependent disulfide-bond oxidoreductase
MITLHAHVNHKSPNTLKLRAALAEAGVPYQYRAVDLDAGEQRRPQFLALNPHGKIPVLVEGDFTLAESDAILWYIGERFPEANLLPPSGAHELEAIQARARVLQWCDFSSTGIYQAYLDVYIHKVKGKQDKQDKQVSWIGEAAVQKMDRLLGVMDGVLTRREFLAGDFSLADLAGAAVLQSVKSRIPGDPTSGRAAIAGWYERVIGRPAWQEAITPPEAAS